MEVCGLVGSPKKNGNVDLLISEVLAGASSKGARIEKLYLNDMNIRPCQSCGVDPYPKFCLIDDDMQHVYEALQHCDAIVFGSPVYFDTVSAQTKLVIDRCNCLMPCLKQPNGTFKFERRIRRRKKGVFITVAGVEQELETIITTAKGFCNWANIELVEVIPYKHEDDSLGRAKNDKEIMSCAFRIGAMIVTQTA